MIVVIVSPIQLRSVLLLSGAATESDRANPASTIPRFPPLTDRISPVDHADGAAPYRRRQTGSVVGMDFPASFLVA